MVVKYLWAIVNANSIEEYRIVKVALEQYIQRVSLYLEAFDTKEWTKAIWYGPCYKHKICDLFEPIDKICWKERQLPILVLLDYMKEYVMNQLWKWYI